MTKLIFRFLKWICPDQLYEEVEGDIIETFDRDSKRLGIKKAKRKMILNTLRFFRPGIILRNNLAFPSMRMYMIANYTGVVLLLSRSFIRNVVVANLIAWPLTSWLMNSWLQSFPYRISINPLIFLLSGTLVALIAVIAISSQTISAALRQPVKTLRYE